MTEVPDSQVPKQARENESGKLFGWRIVRYRSLLLGFGTVVVLVTVLLLLVFPEWRAALAGWLFGARDDSSALADYTARQARFTNLDGDVRVRKSDQVQWISADFSMALEKGDLVQTSKDGVARIAFADGTLYVVQPDTLIAIEENDIQEDPAASQVAVEVSSGVVDLSTSRSSGESKVLFADAEAALRGDSRALVRNHPETNTHQITVSKGRANLERGTERVELAEFEQASFAGPGSPIVKEKIVAPPVLLTPANMAPVVMGSSETAEVQFTWAAVPGADVYRLRVSHSPLFSEMIYDRQVRSTSVRVPSLREGDYYWAVTSIGLRRNEAQESEPNQFSVIRQENEGEILLIVEQFIQHGKVIEIVGRTEPGAIVLVNHQSVFSVAPNGSFKHFTPPLPNVGANLITITAQNSEGKIATLRKTVNIQ